MWKRVTYAEWADWVPYLAFFLTFGVFLVLVVRAILMRKTRVRHLANLPLDRPPGREPAPPRPDTDD